MILLAVFSIPALTGILSFFIKSCNIRRTLLICNALIHSLLTATMWRWNPDPIFDEWLQIDALGLLFLSIISILFLISSFYAVNYLSKEPTGLRSDFEESIYFVNVPEAIFIGCLLLFLSTMSLVTMSHNFGLMWVAIEATTLSSAPLIYYHRHRRSLEATWKYILICSIGIALALLGTFILAFSINGIEGTAIPFVVEDLIAHASIIRIPWIKVAFIFLLVGYGTKMGLAPMHSWLPDAHSEAPSVVSALLSGALLNCAFLGILRVMQVLNATGLGDFARELLIVFGIISVVISTIFIVGQLGFKRMLAYSSIEHMGIIAIGIGLGGIGAFGGLLHSVNHSLAKGMLFLIAGNILSRYNTKSINKISGIMSEIPFSGILWIAGLLAITGAPPFGLFLSEFTIIRRAFESHNILVASILLVALGIIFISMANIFLKMVYGESSAPVKERSQKESLYSLIPPAILCVCILLLGVYVPPALSDLLNKASLLLGGQ